MAYVAQDIPDEEKNKFANQNPTTPYPTAPQGGGSAGTGTNAAPGVGTSTQFGSNAAKLSDYLKQNADQVQEFGNKIAGGLNEGYNQAVGGIDQGFNNFNQQVGQGYAQYDPTLANQAASNPTEFVKNPENVSKFQSLYNDQYQGPQNFESTQPYTDINANVNKAVENASLTSNPSGLSTYLSNQGYYPNATQGVKTLDSALLMGNQGAQQAIKGAASQYSGLGDYLSGKTNEANKNVANAKTQANQAQQTIRNQFEGDQGVVPQFNQGLQDKLTSERAREASEASLQQNLLSNGMYNPNTNQFTPTTNWYTDQPIAENDISKTMGDLGLSREELGNLLKYRQAATTGLKKPGTSDYIVNPYAGDISNYLTMTPSENMGIPNIASQDDYARSAALAQLTGNPDIQMQGGPQGAFNSTQFNRQALPDFQAIYDLIERERKKLPPPDTGTVSTNLPPSGGGGGGNYVTF